MMAGRAHQCTVVRCRKYADCCKKVKKGGKRRQREVSERGDEGNGGRSKTT